MLLFQKKRLPSTTKGNPLTQSGMKKTDIPLVVTLLRMVLQLQLGNSKVLSACFEKRLKQNWRNLQKEIQIKLARYLSTTGCRLLLGRLDLIAQTYLLTQSQRGCVSIAHATALVVIKINPQVVVNINLEYSSWARSLFRPMGLVKREKTSLKVEIPDAARNKPEFLFTRFWHT